MNRTKAVLGIVIGVIVLGLGMFFVFNNLETAKSEESGMRLIQTDFIHELTVLEDFNPDNFDENMVTKQKMFL